MIQSDRPTLLENCRREMRWMIAFWAVLFGWVVGYCRWYGYGDQASTETTFGLPSWVVWGVFVPWIVATVFTSYFAMFVMTDEDETSNGGHTDE